MSFNYDFTKNVEVLDKHNDLNDDIKIEMGFDDFNREPEKKDDWSFMNNNDNSNSNSSTRPNSLTVETSDSTGKAGSTGNADKPEKENTMISIATEPKQVSVAQIKSVDSRSVFKPGNTLNEPVRETFRRDLDRIYGKIKYVLKIRKSEDEEMKAILDWDLWGPLLMCILLSG